PPTSSGTPATRSVRSLPPMRPDASNTVTAHPGPSRVRTRCAAASPLTPPPMIATRPAGLPCAISAPPVPSVSVDPLDQAGEHVRVGVGQHPVPQVDDVPGGALPHG